MKRRLVIAVAILTGLLCVGSLGLWVGSQWYGGWIAHASDSRCHIIEVNRNHLFCGSFTQFSTPAGWSAELHPLDAPYASFAGFSYGRLIRQSWFVDVPFWFPSLIGALACVACIRWLRRNRYGPGLCAGCGYDLRAHQPGQRCPECGTPIATPQP